MSKVKITDYSATRASNSDIDGINIAEGCPAGNMNDFGREIMVQLAEANAGTYPVADTWSFGDPSDLTKIARLDAGSLPTATTHAINAAWLQRKGADIASATTTDLSTATGGYVDITGTTTITGLGTVAAGQVFVLQFDGILTFTHNATSLILPGAANITTAAGDIAVVVSEGSGNWRCVSYQRAATSPFRAWELISTQTPSAAARVVWTGLSAFRSLRLSGFAIPATDAANARIMTSTDNGSSYDSGASDYSSTFLIQFGATVTGSTLVTNAAFLDITNPIGNAANEGIQIREMLFENFNQSQRLWMSGTSAWASTVTQLQQLSFLTQRNSVTARDALQFDFDNGNIASGFLTLEGIRG